MEQLKLYWYVNKVINDKEFDSCYILEVKKTKPKT